jgi:Mn2+/Fe2+ NRAMP family transporter
MERRRAGQPRITDARGPRSEDISRRQTRYILSMLIRTACFVGAVATTGALRWTLVVAAVLLPYVAVVLANAATQRRPDEMTAYTPERLALDGPGERRVL